MTSKTDRELLELAASIRVKKNATHIAVRKDGSKKKCAWYGLREQAYLDEDPSNMKDGEWASCYDERYWKFFAIADVKKSKAIGEKMP